MVVAVGGDDRSSAYVASYDVGERHEGRGPVSSSDSVGCWAWFVTQD